MVFEGARLAARMGLRRPAAAGTPAMPPFLHERAADTQARCDLAWRRFVGLKYVDDPVTQVLRGRLHTLSYAAKPP
jgi:hypothetical protein